MLCPLSVICSCVSVCYVILTAVVVGGAAGVQGPVARLTSVLPERALRLDAALPTPDAEAVLAPGGGEHGRAVRVHSAIYRAAACTTTESLGGAQSLAGWSGQGAGGAIWH